MKDHGTEERLYGADVLKAASKNPMRKYPDRKDARYDDHMIKPDFQPGFTITEDDSVFTIGSCFARNVEEALVGYGITVPTNEYRAVQDNVPGRANRILNQYNPGTMLQCVDTAFGADVSGGLYEVGPDSVVDCLLSTGNHTVTAGRAAERREEIKMLYADGLAKSKKVVITLGLIETWIDLETNTYLNELPPARLVRKDANRFEFRRLGVAECEQLVMQMVERLNHDMARDIVLTVSPVPLQVTFSGSDAVTANCYSKAVLRVVAETISQKVGNVDYFPSYEIVTSAGLRNLAADNVHVRQVVVDRVVNYMLSRYVV